MRRFSWGLMASFVILITGCAGGDASIPTSPSSNPTPSSPPGTGSSGSGQGLLAAVSLSQSSVYGQDAPQGTISLSNAAPAGGVVIGLASSNTEVAKVPATLTIAGGATAVSFTIDTSTVTTSASVTIIASYATVTRSTSLMVRPRPVSAAFTVTSPAQGRGACVLGPSSDEADCLLDASGSTGPVYQWIWTYRTVGNAIGHTAPDALTHLRLTSQCAFFEGARGGDDQFGGKYVQMEIELVVQDREGTRSAPVRQAVRLYPNRVCGFNY